MLIGLVLYAFVGMLVIAWRLNKILTLETLRHSSLRGYVSDALIAVIVVPLLILAWPVVLPLKSS